MTDDALNDTANYTVTEGKGPVLTAGDVNADGVINAQDALNIRTACAASTVPETQLLLTMDLDKIKAAGHPAVVITVVTNTDDFASVDVVASGNVNPGDDMMKVNK